MKERTEHKWVREEGDGILLYCAHSETVSLFPSETRTTTWTIQFHPNDIPVLEKFLEELKKLNESNHTKDTDNS